MGSSGAGGGGSAKNRQQTHAVPSYPPSLSSHIGCRLLGTSTRLPVRVAAGSGGRVFRGRWRAFE